MSMNVERRGFLKGLGLFAAGGMVGGCKITGADTPAPAAADPFAGLERLNYPVQSYAAKTSRQLTAVVIGYGGRGSCYSAYAENYPKTLKMVGVCDIDAKKVRQFRERYRVPAENCWHCGFRDAPAFKEKMADLMFICLPDDLHYEPAMKAMDLGYDIILEKPMAQTEEECRNLLKKQEETKRLVGVGHVLRYAPYFRALKGAVSDGLIGDLVSIQHMEPIYYEHMAHSYVRGNWHDSKKTTPIILAKSCHDLDIIKWIVGKPCKTVSAEGGLKFFTKENCPKGAPHRCIEGCPYEKDCPYSALKIYKGFTDNGPNGNNWPSGWNWIFNIDELAKWETREEYNRVLAEKLRTTDYGKCVFQCDNDQCDHYVANMIFEGGVTAAFSMEAFTPWGGRRTRIMGTTGFIEGDDSTFKLWDFRTGKVKYWNGKIIEDARYVNHGHGGGDFALVRDFLEAVDARDESKLSSTVRASVESHVMGFACEKSRLTHQKVDVVM